MTVRHLWAAAAAVALAIVGLSTSASGQPPARGGGAPAQATPAQRGQALFQTRCASCHEPAVDRAPSRAQMTSRAPEELVTIMRTGVMAPMSAGMSADDMAAVATFLTGRAPAAAADFGSEDSNRCAASNRFNPAGPAWNGWSPDVQNSRLQRNTTITAANVSRMKVKWAFAYRGARYGQPTVIGNRIFTSSSSGRLYALDRDTGCVAWTFTGPGVRSTVSVGRLASAPSGWAVYFGDATRTMVALDAVSAKVLWKVTVETHPRASVTGAPILHGDMLYVPLSSSEETTSSIATYQCCTFRGSVVAINVRTGKVAWKTYAIPEEPKPFKRNSSGTQMYGPAGAAIWSAPTVDARRGAIYVATGDSYTDVKEGSSDAIVAFDMKTGRMLWRRQVTENDNYLTGCSPGRMGLNCPSPVGPDHDFGASPIIRTLPNGRDVVLAGQKSGQVYALDPDNQGRILWQTRIGNGSALGGVEWGMAADNANVYVAVADRGMPTLTALRLTDGALIWQKRAPEPAKCSWQGRCGNGYSGPPSAIPGVAFGVNQDGHIRGFATGSGAQLWDFDTAAQPYDTVNGVKGLRGSNLDANGLAIAGKMMFVISGFNGVAGNGRTDNVLLAFSLDGR